MAALRQNDFRDVIGSAAAARISDRSTGASLKRLARSMLLRSRN
jgi:hypothetical protein